MNNADDTTADHDRFMRLALVEAEKAAAEGEVPIGAIVVSVDGEVLGTGRNRPIGSHDPSAHAEINALRAAASHTQNYRLTGARLYTTLEPCVMCAGAISHARIAELIIAASDKKGGAVWHGPTFFEQPTCHWKPKVTVGPFANEASELLTQFFKERRAAKG
ncbi:MAG: tRNA adenosine(34) deaminase TadA [Pseudomonadota bacterium]